MEEGRGQETIESGERWLRAVSADVIRRISACLPSMPFSDVQWLSLEQVDGFQRCYEANEIRWRLFVAEAAISTRTDDPSILLRRLVQAERMAMRGSLSDDADEVSEAIGAAYGEPVSEGDLHQYFQVSQS